MKAILLRGGRLRKAALVFLTAASAAFFVCAQASAIEIASIGPYHCTSNAIEGESHSMRIDTDVNFVSVTWTAGSHEWIDDNTSTTSVFSYAYNNMGSTNGNIVTVKAVAKDAVGNEDTAEKNHHRMETDTDPIDAVSVQLRGR